MPRVAAGGPNFYTITAVSQTGKHAEAARRFNDLVALHENLKVSYRGCVIPFRPGKTFANSTALRNHKGSFLRDRAYAIRCYLIKVTRHPDIKDSPVCPPPPLCFCFSSLACERAAPRGIA